MSFNIQITGHQDFDTKKEAQAFEQKLVKLTTKLAEEIGDSVRLAFVSAEHIGHVEVAKNAPPEPEIVEPIPPPPPPQEPPVEPETFEAIPDPEPPEIPDPELEDEPPPSGNGKPE